MLEKSTFADMAVALSLAHAKLNLDVTQTEIIAGRVGLSTMGLAVVVEGLRKDVGHVGQLVELMKDLSDIEPQVRALIARKRSRSWLPGFAKVAAV